MTRRFLDVTDDPNFSDPPEAGPTRPTSNSADADERRQSTSAGLLSAVSEVVIGKFRVEADGALVRTWCSERQAMPPLRASQWRELIAAVQPVLAFAELTEIDAAQRDVDRLSAELAEAASRLEAITSRA